MKLITKAFWAVSVLMALFLTGCDNSTSGSKNTTTDTTAVSLTGVVVKGPFVKDGTVIAYQLNESGDRTGEKVEGIVANDLGEFEITVPWSGATEVVASGAYIDENTGALSQTTGEVSAIISVPETKAGETASAVKVNPNVASSMAAVATKASLKKNPTTDVTILKQAIQSSNQATAASLGISVVDGNGDPIDLSALNMLDTEDATIGQASQQLLAVSAMIQDLVTSNADVKDAQEVIATLAKDSIEGKVLGASSGLTDKIKTSQGNVTANIANIIANFNAIIKAEKPQQATIQADKAEAEAKKVAANSALVLRGFAMLNNTFNIDNHDYSVNQQGIATQGIATVDNPGPTLRLSFRDYTNQAGNGAALGKTYNVVFTFSINTSASTDNQEVSGSVPLSVTTDGNGAVAIDVLKDAVMTYSGIDSAGVVVTGQSATNIAANAIQQTSNIISVDFGALISTIQTKVGDTTKAFNLLDAGGSFDFEFNFAGIKLGFENKTLNGLDNLFPYDKGHTIKVTVIAPSGAVTGDSALPGITSSTVIGGAGFTPTPSIAPSIDGAGFSIAPAP